MQLRKHKQKTIGNSNGFLSFIKGLTDILFQDNTKKGRSNHGVFTYRESEKEIPETKLQHTSAKFPIYSRAPTMTRIYREYP